MYNEINNWLTKVDDGTFDKEYNSLSFSSGMQIMAMIIYIYKDTDNHYITFIRRNDNIDDINKYKDMELINKFYVTFIHIGVWPFTDDDVIDEVCTLYNIGDFRYNKRKELGNFEDYIKGYDYTKVPFTDEEYLSNNTFIDKGNKHELPFR
jgi:hypothetical protein